MRPGVVFIGEDEETVDGDRFLTGRFSGYLDKGNRRWDAFHDLSLDEAVAWARERADRIVVHFAYEDPSSGPRRGLPRPPGGVRPRRLGRTAQMRTPMHAGPSRSGSRRPNRAPKATTRWRRRRRSASARCARRRA